ncbi:uncharacterized protein LOC131249573 [Magnolia sinica]|uniref:uncharacterized protein LOC131249573 n=1 Tax=Magnolia sinica TaxID=86752 RepID=UPI00265A2674|nr:uncharacterized protein LOC131249573 [Magnolia sinica]
MPSSEQPGSSTAPCSLFEHFQRLRPPTFASTHHLKEAEFWLNRVTKAIRPPHYTKAEQVELISYLIEKEADIWWECLLRIVPANFVWTWEDFEARFFQKYFPQTYRNEKENEFWRLQQGGMSVAKYEKWFTELSRYAPRIVADEETRMRCFNEGLRVGIRTKMCCANIRTYAELVEMSLRSEQDRERLSRVRLQLDSRGRMGGQSSSSTGRKPHPSSPPQHATPPPVYPQLDCTCGYCKKVSHSEAFCFSRMRDHSYAPPQYIKRPSQLALSAPP